MPPDHGFLSLGNILHNIDLKAAFERLRQVSSGLDSSADEQSDEARCEQCHGVGLLRRDVPATHPEFGKPIECPCGLLAARRQLRIWEASQIPLSLQRFTLDSYAELSGRHALVEKLKLWEATDRWLLLTGDVGVGKTGIAVSALLEGMRRGTPGLYISMPMFLSRIRATYTPNDQSDEMQVLASVVEVPLLVLDDVGVAVLTEWGREKLYTIVNERLILGRRTILTSNLRADDGSLEAHIGVRTWDRIRGAADVLHLTGSSLRGVPGSLQHERNSNG